MAKTGPKKPQRRVLLEELEPRILFSAGIEGLPVDTVVFDDHALVQPYEESLRSLDQRSAAAAEETRDELVIVDADTPDYQTLIDDITGRDDGTVQYEVVVLDADRDGITQISEILADRQDLDAVHVISHGSDGSIALGDTELRFDTLVQNAGSITAWGEAFSEDGDLLLYGCDLAATEAGQSLVDALGRLTGADVAASDDLTGHESLGGDWDLEYQAGEVETVVALDSQAQSDWTGLLANELWYTEKSSFPVEEYTPTTLEPVTGVTSGSMVTGFDIQNFTASGKEVWATHYVTQSVTIGTGTTFTVQQGDLLLTMEGVSTLTGTNGDLTVDKGDVFVFRPTTAGDYSSGSFHMLLDGLGGTNEILGLSLVEQDITVGGQFLAEGSVLYSVKNGSENKQVQHVTAIDAGVTTTLDTPTLFLDGTSAGVGVDNEISGIHLVQSDLSIGDTNLTAGQLLMSLVANDTVGDNGVAVTKSDIFILDISSSTLADATLLFEGAESGVVVDDVRSIALFVDELILTNNVPVSQAISEDTTLTFDAANGNPISITDNAGTTLTVTLSVTNGNLTLSQTTGLAFDAGADGTATMTFTGTVEDINAALDGLQYTPTADYSGSDTLTLTSRDAELYSLEIDSDLLGRYQFEAAAPGDDNSPSGTNTATLVGNATIVTDGTRGDVLSLDGSAHAEIPGFLGEPVDVTLAAWVNLTAYDSNGTDIISLGDNLILRYEDWNDSLNGIYWDGTSWHQVNFLTGINLAGDGWHHVAYSVDDTNNTHAIYFDGVEVASSAMTGSVAYTNGTNSYIGAHGELSPEWDLIGLVDDARIYDRALTATEIATLANAPVQSSDSDTVAITVTQVNDAPVITSDGGGATASVNVVENTTAVTTVTATDLDGDTPTFSISGGADQTLFSIDTNTGALTFNSAPNFEAPTDSDADNVYIVEVTASDGNGGADVQTIRVTVTNESDSTALWLSTDENVGTPGADGMPGGWTESDVLEFSGPNLTHGATTDGELSHV
ncbi:MAG: DUF4347 domain-containing protein, partial [Chromatiales bacterium]